MPNQYKFGNLHYVKERRKKVYLLIDELKSTPCMDCGKLYPPCAMDFDHVRGNKFANVSKLTTYSTSKVLEEIAKCDIVCANCHRIRTHNRRSRVV